MKYLKKLKFFLTTKFLRTVLGGVIIHLFDNTNRLCVFCGHLWISLKILPEPMYICLVFLSRGVLTLYIKTLNKSLGLIYLFLEHCNSNYNVQGFFLDKNW